MIYDGIIVGGGHAGVEAAIALAKMNKNTLLVTGNLDKVASLPCNPSLGGPAKGIVVREIDALGGIQGRASDQAQIQMKMLNSSKGPGVRALRAQLDKIEYPKVVLNFLKETENLTLLEAMVDSLIIEDNKVLGVVLSDGSKMYSKTTIITTGTYLRSTILVGHERTSSGPDGDPTTFGISDQLYNAGFQMTRLKTGTPPRIRKSSLDITPFVEQPGDNIGQTFSHYGDYVEGRPEESCYLLHTTLETKRIINENLDKSSMYSGNVTGTGARYCPSIEDKVVRFSDKDRHQLFLEPESSELDEYYLQGLSTSLPRDVQHDLLKSIPGLEDAEIVRYAYAIEYDAINPMQLKASLETKLLDNLFCAGQINGTSGYEEAACQGLMAGINAGLKLDEKKPFILKRNEAYIGVLIDDLVTKGTKEPYRLLTSRAEYRHFLRNDNADLRLSEYGYELGLLNEADYAKFNLRKAGIENLQDEINNFFVMPNEENNEYLASRNSAKIHEKISLGDLLKRPEINKQDIMHFIDINYPHDIYEHVEVNIKYGGYIDKARRDIEKLNRLEDKKIPKEVDYYNINNISSEAKEKLSFVKPETIGQASRINGVNPTDISILLIYLESGRKVYGV